MNRHLVVRITVDSRSTQQTARLLDDIRSVIAEREFAGDDVDGCDFPTVIDWTWSYEDDE